MHYMHKFIRAEAFYAQNKSYQICKIFYRTSSDERKWPPVKQIDKNQET